MCAINRSSIFFLLSIQIHLCDLVRSLYVGITDKNQRKSQGLIWKVLSAGIPCLLMAISYGGRFVWVHRCMSRAAHGFLVSHDKRMPSVECREDCKRSENYQLNVARHAFSCSMRSGLIWSILCSCMRIMPSSYQIVCSCMRIMPSMYLAGFSTWAPNGVGITCTFFFESLLYPLCVLLWCRLSLFSLVTLNSHRYLRKGLVWWDVACYFVCPVSPSFLCAQCPLSLRCCERVHFIWSSAFTILFCLVCDFSCL